MPFVKATKAQAKARICLIGIPGSGKTYTGLTFARELAGSGGRIAVIDTERGSASKYANLFEFDTSILETFSPRAYIAEILAAQVAGYDVLVIDGLSHAWMGRDGILQMVDDATARSASKNAFTAGWRDATPEHNRLVDTIVQCKCHVICTLRQKTEWLVEDQNGKKVPRKVGLAPVQRDGLEYEFDLVADLDGENKMVVSKSRCPSMSGGVYLKPGPDVAQKFAAWLNDGVAPQPLVLSEAEQIAARIREAAEFSLPAARVIIAAEETAGMALERLSMEQLTKTWGKVQQRLSKVSRNGEAVTA